MFDSPEPSVSRYFLWKRYIDFPLALLLSLFALPVICVLWLLVRLTSPGPGIYTQIRLGLDGKPFTLYKIRTMRHNAEAATGAVWATRNDKRVTAVGNVLRRLHLDELPQLYNVLRGDLALVGPRPERPEFVTVLEKRVDEYAYRLFVMPGLTGLAQLNQPSDIDLNDVRHKLVFDFEYIETSSLCFDMRVLFCSALKTIHLCTPGILEFFRLRRVASQSSWSRSLLPANDTSVGTGERLSQIMIKQTTV